MSVTHQETPPHVPTIAEQQAFWNEWDRKYREDRPLDHESARRRDTVLDSIRQLRLTNPAILEVGCANGWLSSSLAQFGQVVGLDLAEDVVQIAAARYPHIQFIAGDFLTTKLAQTFDIVVSLEALAFFPDQPAFIARLAEVLRPGGHLVLTTHNKFVYDRRMDVAPLAPGQYRHWTTRAELRRLLSTRFRILDLRTIAPANGRGVLRLASSYKVNATLNRLIGREKTEALKERIGLGTTFVVLAQVRPFAAAPGQSTRHTEVR